MNNTFERKLKKFIKEHDVRYKFVKIGEVDDVIISPVEPIFDEFISLFSQSDLEGKQINFSGGYFHMEIGSIINRYGLELEDVFFKEEK